jgi:hypothetical protein
MFREFSESSRLTKIEMDIVALNLAFEATAPDSVDRFQDVRQGHLVAIDARALRRASARRQRGAVQAGARMFP